MFEADQNGKTLLSNMSKTSFPVQQEILDKSAKMFEYLLRKNPAECMQFLRSYEDKDEFIKAQMESIKTTSASSSGNSKEYGLGFLRGNFPKIST